MLKKILPVFLILMPLSPGCGGAQQQQAEAVQEDDMSTRAEDFIKEYTLKFEKAEKALTHAYWHATTTGENYEKIAESELALRKIHQDADAFKELEAIYAGRQSFEPRLSRQVEIAYLYYKADQVDPALTKEIVDLSSEIEQAFNTHRAVVDGQELTDNEIVKILRESTDNDKRKKAWEGIKQVGPVVAERVVKLAKLRNQVAQKLGFKDYWYMRITLQEHDPDEIISLFEKLEQLTNEPFKAMKQKLDTELASKFGIEIDELRPWHYADPFFQEAPPGAGLDLEQFFSHRKKEDLPAIAARFYSDIGLDAEDILARSDLYEREKKLQHAYCISMDRKNDIRILANMKPTVRWMDTILHELGHALYYKYTDDSLPFLLREAAHALTTEAVAMLFGALAKNGLWLEKYADVPTDKITGVSKAAREQRLREQLIFARWSLVMMNFEREFYQDPDQDLQKLWWDIVERYQMLTRPEERDERPEERDEHDWATKIHLVMVPVYYHNYIMGEMYAAQLRSKLAEMAGHTGHPAGLDFAGRKDFGEFLINEVFMPGMSMPWPELVEASTGQRLNPSAFARELSF